MDRVVASYGDKLSGITTGDSLKSFAEWSLLDDGRIVFYAGLSGNKPLWTGSTIVFIETESLFLFDDEI